MVRTVGGLCGSRLGAAAELLVFRGPVLVGHLLFWAAEGWRFLPAVSGRGPSRVWHGTAWSACSRVARRDDRVLTWDEAVAEGLLRARRQGAGPDEGAYPVDTMCINLKTEGS